MRYARYLLPLITALSLGAASAAPPVATRPPRLVTLKPGGSTTLTENVTVNVVFVGYEQGTGPQNINEAALRGLLPAAHQTQVRTPAFFGFPTATNLKFNYKYNLVYAGNGFENQFFNYLKQIAENAPLTTLQEAYNEQEARSLTISSNQFIDAPSVERWLGSNAGGALGIDTTRPTVFLVNWYGRSDFRHHVYTKTGEPDPDTGVDFGVERDSRKIIAWGGTAPDDPQGGPVTLQRIWFYDLSAGPESWTDNWNLTDADVDGDEILDYRMPPVWEYGNLSGYRPFDNLSTDLARILRFVAINTLFTTSPIYDPGLGAPRLASNFHVNINSFEGSDGSSIESLLNLPYVTSKLGALRPLNTFTAGFRSQPLEGEAADVYNSWLTAFTDTPTSYYGDRLGGDPFGDPFLFVCDHLSDFRANIGEHEIPVFVYNTTDEATNPDGLLGYADYNYLDGAQSFIFAFYAPLIQELGFGNSSTVVHEAGHYLGLSHPHDGYDPGLDVDYDATGPFYYAWAGDESNTVMGYLSFNDDFGQFDRDNMNRYLVSVYVNQANAILGRVYQTNPNQRLYDLARRADVQASVAYSLLRSRRYDQAVTAALAAYNRVLLIANMAHVSVAPVDRVMCPPEGTPANTRGLQIEAVDQHRHRP